jgi:hemoglobin-like flavoprotein
MNQHQIDLIKNSFNAIKPQAQELVDLFYDNLFKNKPEFRALFPIEMKDQKQKLLSALTLVVNSLEKLETILPAIQDLGRKHSQNYGVKAEDYPVVGATLLQSMKSILGASFTAETESAWAGAYQVLAKVMSEA